MILALAVKRIALHFKIVDYPSQARKKHGKPVPLLGGIAPFAAFFTAILVLLHFKNLPQNLSAPVFYLLLGSFIIMLGGILDDKYRLSPKWQIVFPVAAIIIALYGGISIKFITNPFGGMIYLGILPSLALTFIWLLTISYTTKILDGLDGLVAGMTILCAFSIFLFSTVSQFKESDIAVICLALMGSFAGFLLLNKYPARLFLGEGGSLFAGFILGALAILTGAKIAVALMVLSLPLIDLLAVIIKRALKKKSIFLGDRAHLHYFLIDRGWRPQSVVYLFWALAAALGIASIFLPSLAKIIFLFAVLAVFFFIDLCWAK